MADEKDKPVIDVEYDDDGKPIAPPPVKDESAEAGTKNEGTGAGEKDDKDEGGFDDTITEDKPPEIPVRKSVVQHIIARKDNKIAKLESKLEKKGTDPEEDGEGEGQGDDNQNDKVTSKDDIKNVIEETLSPFISKMVSDADQAEIDALVKSDPDASKYVNHIKAYMQHDAWKNVPPEAIYHHLAWNNAKSLGAKKKKAADLEAEHGKDGGGRNITENPSPDGLPTAEDIAGMSEEDFAKMEADVLQGKYLK